MFADAAGNVYVGGHSRFPESDWDIILVKYDPTGARLWQAQYDENLRADFTAALAVVGTTSYLTGSSINPEGNVDFLTLKYDDNGVLDWAARYNGTANGPDYPVALAVDAAGHVVVAGNSPGPTSHTDFVIVTYDAAGQELWSYRYDGPNQNDDRVAALRLDAQGNIHIAGTSGSESGGTESVTLKIDPDGHLLWVRRYFTAAVGDIDARGLALDGTGNVIVTASANWEVLTLKYGADGGLAWEARYRAEEDAGMVGGDVRVDPDGNVVMGCNLYGSGINDSVLVKYDADGHQLWASRVAHPEHPYHFYDMDMDTQGNIYITGEPQPDALTVKIGADGGQRWRAVYHSKDEFYDVGQLVRANNQGDVFMAGRSIYFGQTFVSVVKYEQTTVTGAPAVSVSPSLLEVDPGASVTLTAAGSGNAPLSYQWRHNGRNIAGATSSVLVLDDVQVADRGDYSVIVSNMLAVTISPEARLIVLELPGVTVAPTSQVAFPGGEAGFAASVVGTRPFTFQWRHDGVDIAGATNAALQFVNLAASDAGAYAVVVSNPAGSVTSSTVSLTISRAVVQSQGLGYNGQGNRAEGEPLMRLGPNGIMAVAASSGGFGTGGDIATLCYAASGELLWEKTFNRTGADEDMPMDLAFDGAGNIYVTGWSGQPYSDRVFTTIKYSPMGEPLWVRHFAEAGAYDNSATSLAVDAAGQATVAGRVLAETGSLPVAVRYDADGTQQWVAYGENSGYESTQAVVIDSAGNTYLGAAVLRDEDTDFFLRKLDTSGETVWTRTFDAGSGDHFTSLALDPAGNVVLLGRSFLHAADGVLLKFAPDGTRLWEATFDSLPFQNDFTRALAVDAAGNTVVVSSLEDYDDDQLGTSILRFDSEGRQLYAVIEPDLEVSDSIRMEVDGFGNAYVTGTATVKYDTRGRKLWQVDHAGPGWFQGYGTAVSVNAIGDVLVAGQDNAIKGTGTDLLLLRYGQEDPSGRFRLDWTRLSDGTVRLMFPLGYDFVVEASEDLRQWNQVTEAELQALHETGLPGSLPNGQRFYRLVRAEGAR